jgi:hypothetical protein
MPAMNALLFGVISVAFMSAAFVPGPDEAETKSGLVASVEQVAAKDPQMSTDGVEAAKAAADDLEVARLMAAAPDEGAFGDSVIVDPVTGIETRISGFGFSDK